MKSVKDVDIFLGDDFFVKKDEVFIVYGYCLFRKNFF